MTVSERVLALSAATEAETDMGHECGHKRPRTRRWPLGGAAFRARTGTSAGDEIETKGRQYLGLELASGAGTLALFDVNASECCCSQGKAQGG